MMGITADCADFGGADELLARARAGEAQAFCRLAAQHERRLLQQATGLTRDPGTAEDLVSETFVEAWRSLARYNGACRFSTWLFAILLHRHQKHVRHARSRPVPLASLPVFEADQHRQTHENLPASGPSPSDEAMRKDAAEALCQVIESLSEKHRRVLLLRFFEDASLSEIATLLDCSLGTVKSRLHYALEELRQTQHGLNLSDLWRDT